jgi:hypothetical protein
MSKNNFPKISELAWEQKNIIENVKMNRDLNRYILGCHVLILICTIIYGAVLGYYAKGEQIILDAIKIPILFLITLYIAIPIFFIVDALQGNKISMGQISTLILLGFSSASIVLIAFTPLMFFFIFTTLEYSFIAILNIVICGFAGYFGIFSIYSSFKQFHKSTTWYPSLMIGSFIIIFVGTQLAWTLRPFFHISSQFTRPISGNFYVALARLIEENPIVSIILITIFGLIAAIITYNWINNDSRLDSTTAQGANQKVKRKLKETPIQTPPPPTPNYSPPFYPGQVWGITQPIPTIPPQVDQKDEN